MIILLKVGLVKKILLNKMSYFHTHNKNKIKVELDLSNYAAKSDLKNRTGVDTLNFAKKADLDSSKSKVDELDIDKLKIYHMVFDSWYLLLLI